MVTVGSRLDWLEVVRSEEHTSELQSPCNLVCRLLLEKKNNNRNMPKIAPDRRHLAHVQRATRRRRPRRDERRRNRPPGTQRTRPRCCVFFFNDTATTEIYTLSLHDALPI